MFKIDVDIANRALQHCGRDRIASLLDKSDSAREIAFAYDKVRRAELRRNIWRFATRRAVLRPRDISTYLINPVTWTAPQIYVLGSVVQLNGLFYISNVHLNQGFSPDTNPTQWSLYYGPLLANLWQDPAQGSPSAYWAGEVVYTPQNEGYVVYVSLTSGNSDTPGVYPTWDGTKVYNVGDTVLFTTTLISDPGAIPVFSDPQNGQPLIPMISQAAYQSIQDLNVNQNPSLTPTSWVKLPIPGQPDNRFGQNWLQLDARLTSLYTPYPLLAGPATQLTTKNAFYLPAGFLREAPQDPKGGTAVYLGALSGLPVTDYNFEGNWIVSQSLGPIMLRFIADLQDVTQMDDMFCEGLAARLAKEVAPVLLRDRADRAIRQQRIDLAYKMLMDDARQINAIEIGFIDPPMDDFIACRF